MAPRDGVACYHVVMTRTLLPLLAFLLAPMCAGAIEIVISHPHQGIERSVLCKHPVSTAA
jgi:hypothetical protein